MSSMARWKMAGAFARPNGSTLNSKSPSGTMKAVSFLCFESRGNCHNPDVQSRDIKNMAFRVIVMSSSGRGIVLSEFAANGSVVLHV